MKYRSYNPNPIKGNNAAGDCVIRMLTRVLDVSWEEAFCILMVRAYSMCTMPSANSVWASILLDNGYEEFSAMNKCKQCYTFKDFINEHEEDGKYYVLCSGTHTCFYDGLLWDSWNSSNEPLLYYFVKDGGDDVNEQ